MGKKIFFLLRILFINILEARGCLTFFFNVRLFPSANLFCVLGIDVTLNRFTLVSYHAAFLWGGGMRNGGGIQCLYLEVWGDCNKNITLKGIWPPVNCL